MAQGWTWLCYVDTPELEVFLADWQSPRNQDLRDQSLARRGSLSFITLLITRSIPSSKSRAKYKGEAAISPRCFPSLSDWNPGDWENFSGSIGNAYRQYSALVFEAYGCEIGVLVDRPRYRRSWPITFNMTLLLYRCRTAKNEQAVVNDRWELISWLRFAVRCVLSTMPMCGGVSSEIVYLILTMALTRPKEFWCESNERR